MVLWLWTGTESPIVQFEVEPSLSFTMSFVYLVSLLNTNLGGQNTSISVFQ